MKKILAFLASFIALAATSCLDLENVDNAVTLFPNMRFPFSCSIELVADTDMPVSQFATTLQFASSSMSDQYLKDFSLKNITIKGVMTNTSDLDFSANVHVKGIGGDPEKNVTIPDYYFPAHSTNLPFEITFGDDTPFSSFESIEFDVYGESSSTVKAGDKIAFSSEYFCSSSGMQVNL